jgi:hypothetical protein
MRQPPDAGNTALWWRHPATFAILAANVLPLAGVLFFGWSLFQVMLLFWADNVVIGLYMALRIRLTYRSWPVGRGYGSIEYQIRGAIFGLFAYFFFTFIHGLFLVLIFRDTGSLKRADFVVALLALVASRGFDLYDTLRSPARAKRNDEFVRVVVLHVGLVGGAFLAVWLGTPVAVLALLVVLKAASDIFARAKGRR